MSAYNLKDLTGQKFGRLTVIKRNGSTEEGKAKWDCLCDCGNTVTVVGKNITHSFTRSCGCLKKEFSDIRFTTHGSCNTRLYKIWCSIHYRCKNINSREYKYYGERGISVCGEWDDFTPFKEWSLFNGYADTLTIDRRDNNGNYEPSNCRWVTYKVQGSNKRNNHLLTCNNKTQTLTQWSSESNIPYYVLQRRININHWSAERALTTPLYATYYKYLTYKGETHPIKYWCDMFNISYTVVKRRINSLKWSTEKALTTPIHKYKHPT